MKNIILYLFHLTKGFLIRLCPVLCLGLIGISISFLLIALSKQAIDTATDGYHESLSVIIGLLAIFIGVSILLKAFVTRLTISLHVKLDKYLTLHFFSHILRADWHKMNTYHSGDIMSRINTDIGDIVRFYTNIIPQFILGLLKLVGAFIFLYFMNKMLAMVLIGLIPAVLFLSKIYFRKMKILSNKIKESSSIVKQYFQESVRNNHIIKGMSLETLFENRLNIKQRKNISMVMEQNNFSIYSSLILSTGFASGYIIAFSWGLFELQAGIITFGTLVAFIQLVNMIQGPSVSLMNLAPIFVSAYTAAERLREIDNVEEENLSSPIWIPSLSRIDLTNVSFSYIPNYPVIDRLNITFRKGSMTALTGETGCGKTTLIKLLLSFIYPQRGNIMLSDGKNMYPANSQTRVNFAYVPQDNMLFSGTIRENLSVTRPDITDNDIIKVLKQVSADFVMELPEGLNTYLLEGGQGLSGGQIQRLAIARALLSSASVLLLDEVTSSLDETTEMEIIYSLKNYVHDKIIIVVSHRLNVISACDNSFSLNWDNQFPKSRQQH